MKRRATHKLTEELTTAEAADRLRPKDVPKDAAVQILLLDPRDGKGGGIEVEWKWTEDSDGLET